MPESNPVTNPSTMMIEMILKLYRISGASELPVKLLSHGSNINTMGIANKTAIKEMKIDSPRNCMINDDLTAPTTFRTPISRALRIHLAVVRLIKLIQAIN